MSEKSSGLHCNCSAHYCVELSALLKLTDLGSMELDSDVQVCDVVPCPTWASCSWGPSMEVVSFCHQKQSLRNTTFHPHSSLRCFLSSGARRSSWKIVPVTYRCAQGTEPSCLWLDMCFRQGWIWGYFWKEDKGYVSSFPSCHPFEKYQLPVAQMVKNPIKHWPGFDPWVRKIPWRRAWQPTPVFLPGESPWTEESGRSPWGCRVRHNWATKHSIQQIPEVRERSTWEAGSPSQLCGNPIPLT